MKIKGLITAAGLSTRMGDFKPLMRINGFPMIRMTVQSMKNAAIEDICVVTGLRAAEVEAAATDMNVCFQRNSEYAATDMLHSIKLGLERLGDFDAVFLLPVDMPLISPEVFKRLFDALGGGDVIHPVHSGKRGHPLLFKRACLDSVLGFNESGGLEKALKPFNHTEVQVGDACIAMDADTAENFESMSEIARRLKGVSQAVCEKLYDEADLAGHIREHCRAVGVLAREMAERLVSCGLYLDVELCASGGALHDIKRLSSPHELTGAAFLRERGYEALAGIVEVHGGFKGSAAPEFDEKTVVCLADKLVKDTYRVTIRARYDPVLEQFSKDSDIRQRILANVEICESLVSRYLSITGDNLEKF